MQLYLVRHAEAATGDSGSPDRARALTPNGERQAGSLGGWLAQRNARPARVLCSSARRAVGTLRRLTSQPGESPGVEISDELYLASANELLELIRGTPAGVEELMLIGHNPGIGELAWSLAGGGDPGALERLASRFPPASVAHLRFGGDSWDEVRLGGGDLVALRVSGS